MAGPVFGLFAADLRSADSTKVTISFDTPSTLDPSRCPTGKAVARPQMLDVPCHVRGDAAGEIPVGAARRT